MDQTGVSLSSMADSNGGGDADEDLSFSMERLETVSFHNGSSASTRGKMAQNFLDKTSSTTPSLPYASSSNDDLLNGDDIPIARPVGFERSSENNSTFFNNGKAAFI